MFCGLPQISLNVISSAFAKCVFAEPSPLLTLSLFWLCILCHLCPASGSTSKNLYLSQHIVRKCTFPIRPPLNFITSATKITALNTFIQDFHSQQTPFLCFLCFFKPVRERCFRNISFCCYSEQWFSILTISETVSQCWELACDFFSCVQTGKCTELCACLCFPIKHPWCLLRVSKLCLTCTPDPSAQLFLTFSGTFQPLGKKHVIQSLYYTLKNMLHDSEQDYHRTKPLNLWGVFSLVLRNFSLKWPPGEVSAYRQHLKALKWVSFWPCDS